MANPLPFVEIPGFAEAVRREQELRDCSLLAFPESIVGIPVRPLTLRDVVALDAMKNGFVVPFVFESDLERVVQAVQFLWYMSTGHRVPRGWLDRLWMSGRQARFVRHTMRLNAESIFTGIRAYLDEAWYDNPYSGGDDGGGSALKASFAVYIVDHLYAAGYPWSEAEVMAMPLKKLWQYVRISGHRLNPEASLANRSDLIAVNFIAERDKLARAKEAAHG